jgi:hypothetical protein
MITYRTGNDLDLIAVIDLYQASTLGARRPVEDSERMAAMMKNANIVVTAWDGDLLVGISRALSDFSYVPYLSDLAVRVTQQEAGPLPYLILLAAPAAAEYYSHIGFKHHPRAWMLESGESMQ